MDKPKMTIPHDLWLSLSMVSAEAVQVVTALLKQEEQRLRVDLKVLFDENRDGEDVPAVSQTIYDTLAGIEEMNQLLPKIGDHAKKNRDESDAYWAEEWPIVLEEAVTLQHIPFTSVYEEVRP